MAHDGLLAGDNLFLEDLHGDRPRVEILGNTRVTVENHKGILEYDDTVLRVKAKGCEVRITGDGLTLAALTLGELIVTGVIVSVDYRTGG